MTDGGYVRLHRQLSRNPVWTQLSPSVLKVFLYCLWEANFKPSKWYDGCRQVDVPVGCFITSLTLVSKNTLLSRQQVRDALKHLQNLEIATCSTTQRYTLVSITNYRKYNPSAQTENTPENHWGTNEEPMRNQCGTPSEEVKKERRKEEYKLYPQIPLPQTDVCVNGGQTDALSKTARINGLFERFWESVWRKVGKEEARAGFTLALKTVCRDLSCKADDATEFLIGQALKEPDRAAVAGNEFRGKLHPATWLRKARWKDEISSVIINSGGPPTRAEGWGKAANRFFEGNLK